MADVSFKTSFSVYREGTKVLEAEDIITQAFKKYLAWLLYRRDSPPDREYFVNYHHYITDRFLMAFGTGTTPPTGNETDLEKPVVLNVTEQDVRLLYWYIPKSSKLLKGKYWRPSINEDAYTIRLVLDLPGRLFTDSGHANDITEIGIFVGVPLSPTTFKRLAFRWWWSDYMFNDYIIRVNEARDLGLISTETITTYRGSTHYLVKRAKSIRIRVNFPYSSNSTLKHIPYIYFVGRYSSDVTYNLILAKVLMARIVLPEPISFEPGYTYSFRYTIYKK